MQRLVADSLTVQREGGVWNWLISMVSGMAAGAAVGIVHSAGVHDENKVTNVLFWARHPSMAGKKIAKAQRDLARDWLFLRDTYVRPFDPKRSNGDNDAPAVAAARVVVAKVHDARRLLAAGAPIGAISKIEGAIETLEQAHQSVVEEVKWLAATKGTTTYLDHRPSKAGVDKDLARLARHLSTVRDDLKANQDKMREGGRFEGALYSDLDLESPPLVDYRFDLAEPRFESMMQDAHRAFSGAPPFWDTANNRPQPNPERAYFHLTRAREHLAQLDVGGDRKRTTALRAIRAHLDKVDGALATQAAGFTNAPSEAVKGLDLRDGPLPGLLFAIGATTDEINASGQ